LLPDAVRRRIVTLMNEATPMKRRSQRFQYSRSRFRWTSHFCIPTLAALAEMASGIDYRQS